MTPGAMAMRAMSCILGKTRMDGHDQLYFINRSNTEACISIRPRKAKIEMNIVAPNVFHELTFSNWLKSSPSSNSTSPVNSRRRRPEESVEFVEFVTVVVVVVVVVVVTVVVVDSSSSPPVVPPPASPSPSSHGYLSYWKLVQDKPVPMAEYPDGISLTESCDTS